MTNPMEMRVPALTRRNPSTGAVLVLVCLASLLLPKMASDAAIPGDPCDGAAPIKGVGALPQANLFLDLFIPRYESHCPTGLGNVSYDSLGDPAAIRSVVRHDTGQASPSDPPYLIYATDLPLNTDEKYSADVDLYHPLNPRTNSVINHLPMHVYAVAVGYNLGICEAGQPIKLTSRSLSLIYSGIVTRWNDPLLVDQDPSRSDDDNLSLRNCPLGIRVAKRDDEASATIVFKDYLSQSNPAFQVYKRKELNRVWPGVGLGCPGQFDLGMNTCLDEPGTIAYVLYQSAWNQSYRLAYLENAARQFVPPATVVWPREQRTIWPDRCTEAAQASTLPVTTADWSRVSLTGTTVGYPLCAFGYMLTWSRPWWSAGVGSGEIRTLYDFLTVAASDPTQSSLTSQHVAPIPQNVRTIVRTAVDRIQIS